MINTHQVTFTYFGGSPEEVDESIFNEFESLLKQIQLDAFKEGMRRAAIHAEYDKRNGHHGNDMMSFQNIHQAILTTAEQLTLSDL